MTTAGNLLVMIGANSLDGESRRLLLDDDWRLYASDSAFDDLWFAVKVATGADGPYTLFYNFDQCFGPSAESYAMVVELTNATITPLWNFATGNAMAVAWDPITMLGQGTVFAVAVTHNGASPLTTAPAGYGLLDSFTFSACPYAEMLVWARSVATAGVETPSASDDPGVLWLSATIGIHGLGANVLETTLLELSPASASTPHDNGTDSGVFPEAPAEDAFPLPPDPSGIVVPGPTWGRL